MYLEMLKNSFKQCLVYRTNTVLRFLSSFVYLFVTVSIWMALYSQDSTVDGIAFEQMLTYVLITQVLRRFENLRVSAYFEERIVGGNISLDFVRPFHPKYTAIFMVVGEVLFSILVFDIPMVVIGALLWGIVLPSSLWQWLMFFVTAFFAAYIYILIEYVMGLSVFWFKTGFHIQWTVGALSMLFSGTLVPLWFYPTWLRDIANVLPFRFVLFEPANIFVGNASFAQSLNTAGFQLLWILALSAFGGLLWSVAQKSVFVQGG